MGHSFGLMEQALMASGATVSSVAKDATKTAVPLVDVLVAGDFVGGRMYLSSAVVPWNGSATAPTPGTWVEIGAQDAAPIIGTAIIVPSAALAAAPIQGVRVYLLRPSQSGGTIGKVDQGAAGSSPWPVTDQPTGLTGAKADGASVSADESLFSAYYTPTGDGTVLVTVAVDSSGTAAVLQETHDGGTKWWELRSGAKVQPGQEVAIALQVKKGESWGVSFAAATTLGTIFADWVSSI